MLEFTDTQILHQGNIIMDVREEPYWKKFFTSLKEEKNFYPKSVLELGLGMGITARLIKEIWKPPIHHIVELFPEVIEKYGGNEEDPFNVIQAEAFGYLEGPPITKYDLIVMDIVGHFDIPREDLEKYLNPGGILLWITTGDKLYHCSQFEEKECGSFSMPRPNDYPNWRADTLKMYYYKKEE